MEETHIMISKKRGTLLAISAALGACFATTAAAGEKYTIGYSQFWGTIPFSQTQVAGARKAAAEWKEKGADIELIVTNGGNTDTTKQVGDVEDLYTQGVNGLLIFPGDSVVLAEPIKNVFNANNIPVVVTDIGLQSGSWDSFIITDNVAGGKIAAELMAKNVKPGSKVIVFDFGPANDNVQARVRGFETEAKARGLSVLPRKVIKLSLEEGRRAMEDTLVETPDIAGVFFENEVVAQGAAATLEAAQRNDVKIVTFDLSSQAYDLVKEGKILGVVVQDPYKMGYVGMNAMMTKLTGGVPEKRIELETKLLTKENVLEFAQDPQVTGK
ncbi:substrate-binding domain-containing protein [Rhizobium lentis]|nr:substrate-binding domain-containing protein [Rhizobium bangladeshense]MBX5020771.1 substrate-binding domain-containing protein [Rhizobium lentis]MBX5214040.1 substrate-binding domain-containing protein [Rhizobium sp. NLR9a]MBX5219218.1 substrate-binding domain-containing protein [Rhizobium sp. NLR8a]MBX5275017.1 substrate-binding domain-containing protein [Rhizobium sp. NLR13a]MBX5294751.1 substrate-binding domain-containing protein [Rhizobium sp. NLR15a]